MFKKLFKYLSFSSLLAGFFLAGFANASMEEFSQHEIILNKQGDVLISDLILEREPFNSVSIQLNEVVSGLMVDFGGGFEEVEIHDDGFGAERLMFTAPSHKMQFKLMEPGAKTSLKLKVMAFYSNQDGYGGPPANLQASTQLMAQSYEVIKRAEWGADEDLRIWDPERATSGGEGSNVNPCAEIEKNYANQFTITSVEEYNADGQPLTWPISQAAKLERIVLHHTDSDIRDINGDSLTDYLDYAAMVRAIYTYHTVTRGWGDIGYNYIIDPLGNIYEGRVGGDKSIAAHSLCYNHGALGIAIIGNYENKPVPEPALQAAIQLIGQKAKLYNIDVQKTSTFRDKNLPGLFGHKDVRATSCPGKQLYAQLDYIRSRAALLSRNFSESNLNTTQYDYNAELVGVLNPINLNPGERKSITLQFKNNGTKAWEAGTWLHVALNTKPGARIIPVVQGKLFVAADLKEASVAPGKTGTFVVDVQAGYQGGSFSFELTPVINGLYKISRSSEFIALTVSQPNFDYEIISSDLPSGDVFNGQHIVSKVKLKNTGNTIWRNYGSNPIRLGTKRPQDHPSLFSNANPTRIGQLLESEVPPGAIGEFNLNLFVPEDKVGRAVEYFAPVIEGAGWMEDKGLQFIVSIKKPNHLAKVTKLEKLSFMYPGERRFVEVDITNLGDLPWDSQTFQTTLLGRGIKVFKRTLLPPDSVQPGQTTRIGFWIEAPLEGGQHSVYLRSRFNLKPIRGATASFNIQVPSPDLKATKVSQSESTVSIAPNQTRELTVQFKNTSNTVWKKMGYHAVRLATSNPHDRESKLYHEATWINKQRAAELVEDEVAPGEIGTFKFTIAPRQLGSFVEEFQVVMERYGWMEGATVRFAINVTSNPLSATSSSTPARPSPVASIMDASTPPVPSDEKPFRVRISHDASIATLTANTSFVILNESAQVLFSYSAGKEVSVRKVSEGFEVLAGGITKKASIVRIVPKEANGVSKIVTMERRPTWDTSGTLNDNLFRGVIELRLIDGQVAYINELPLEDYMKGLAEVSNSDHPEKLKVIAYLARTYARFYMDEANRKFPGMPYDGNDDPAIFQRYLGYGVELRSPNFVKAVEATRDMVVTYNGKLVKTPYFNQSNGKTLSAEAVWGWTNTPYLKSVADPWSNGLELKGHGVGLSGYGASGQAKEGKKAEEIIKYYYTGVEIEKLSF